MGRKIFVSYKHKDKDVYRLPDYDLGTARDYVDYLIDDFEGEEIYKGEGNEDLSEFKDETIKTRLKDKIHDSSITLVLISPNMKDRFTIENDQWIPWEISYSLKEITRDSKKSHTNAILAVVLPDSRQSYSYYIKDKTCVCGTKITLKTYTLFQILSKNMFNHNDLENKETDCSECHSYPRDVSYIQSVKWQDFIDYKDDYIDKATEIRDDRKNYKITKEVTE